MRDGFIKAVRAAARKRMLFLPHALSQMNSPGRMISDNEVRRVVLGGKIIENHPFEMRRR